MSIKDTLLIYILFKNFPLTFFQMRLLNSCWLQIIGQKYYQIYRIN